MNHEHNCLVLSVESKSLDDGSIDQCEDSSEVGSQKSYAVVEFLCNNVSYLNSEGETMEYCDGTDGFKISSPMASCTQLQKKKELLWVVSWIAKLLSWLST